MSRDYSPHLYGQQDKNYNKGIRVMNIVPPSETRIEISLLRCLEALLTEKSVTRAADKLGMSQPGMSNALARLRTLTRDPLLVRSGSGMDLTQRAIELLPLTRSGLVILEDIFSDARPFEPSRVEGVLTLAVSDSMSLLLGPRLVSRFDAEAPKLSVRLHRLDHSNLFKDLIEGRCDLAVGYFTVVPEQLYAAELLSESMCVIRAARHPRIGEQLTLQDYITERHVLMIPPNHSLSWPESAVAEALKAFNLTRIVGARVNSILMSPPTVAESTMLCTLPAWIARRAAEAHALKLHPLPFESKTFLTSLVWHERTHRQGLHQWVRANVRRLVEEVVAGSTRPPGHRAPHLA
jgi:DNA-binding transcriptional LysR family regulator